MVEAVAAQELDARFHVGRRRFFQRLVVFADMGRAPQPRAPGTLEERRELRRRAFALRAVQPHAHDQVAALADDVVHRLPGAVERQAAVKRGDQQAGAAEVLPCRAQAGGQALDLHAVCHAGGHEVLGVKDISTWRALLLRTASSTAS